MKLFRNPPKLYPALALVSLAAGLVFSYGAVAEELSPAPGITGAGAVAIDIDKEDQEELDERRQVWSKSKKEGDKAPDFELKDGAGKLIKLSALLRKGPVVLAFYRGGWCPFCTSELRDLEVNLDQLQKAGATLVAISPQIPSKSEWTETKNQLTFPVLSDPGSKVASQFGLTYKIHGGTMKRLKANGVKLSEFNGTDDGVLPLPWTYVVDRNFNITYAFVDADFRKRAKAIDVIHAVESNKKTSKASL